MIHNYYYLACIYEKIVQKKIINIYSILFLFSALLIHYRQGLLALSNKITARNAAIAKANIEPVYDLLDPKNLPFNSEDWAKPKLAMCFLLFVV